MIKLLLVEDDVNLCYIVQAGLQDVDMSGRMESIDTQRCAWA